MSNKKTTWVCNGRRRTGLETEPCSLANDCTFQVSGSYVPVGCTIFGNDTYRVANWVKKWEREAEGIVGSGERRDTSSAVIAAARWFIDHEGDFMFSEYESEFENERDKHIARIMDKISHKQLAALMLSLMMYSSEFDDCLKHIEEMEQ